MSTGLPKPRRFVAILAISAGIALFIIDASIATVALPTIARDLKVDSASVVLIVTVYQLVLVMGLLPFSTLGDRIGHRRLYQAGLLTFTIASFFCLFAKSLPILLIIRATQALSAAAALSVASAMIRGIYPFNLLGRGLAVNSVVGSSAAAIAPTLGGLILSFGSWQLIFITGMPIALLSLLLSSSLPESERREEPVDLWGALMCALTFGLLIAGLESAVHGDSPLVSAVIVLTGLVIGYRFVRRELGEPRPVLPVDLLANPVLAFSSIGSFAAFIGSMTLLLSLPFRLQHGYGFAPSEVGAIIAPWPLGIMLMGPASVALSDRISPGLLGAIGMVINAIALVFIAFLPANPHYLDIAWRMALAGAGMGMFASPNGRLFIEAAPLERVAAAGALMQTTRLVGQTAGATVVAALLALGLGGGKTPGLVAAGLALIAAVCSAARMRPPRHE
jgi:DHA2 family multidrug resistance protein-like MFS transporter